VRVEPVDDVFSDGPVEKNRFLLHYGDTLMIPLHVKLADVFSIKEYLSFAWVIEPLN